MILFQPHDLPHAFTNCCHKDVKILLNTCYNPQGEDLAGLLD